MTLQDLIDRYDAHQAGWAPVRFDRGPCSYHQMLGALASDERVNDAENE